MTYCGNNEYDRALTTHRFGTYKECFKKVYARGYNQKITDLNGFIVPWTGDYKPHVIQHLLYGAGALPSGYQRATLSQMMQRGFGLGSISRAKAEKKKLTQRPQTSERHNNHAS